MPMGNSITYDENSYDEEPHIRPVGDRISYRYKLYQLITQAGYSFDFVGSEDAGNNYFQNAEMDDNAGFPGIDKEQLAYLMRYGKNLRTGIQVTPGPYLLTYPADIILLHIGTNNLNEDATLVSDLLDRIREYAPNVIVLVARIIDRVPHSSTTTKFNDNVQAMIASRGDSKIISVNMETGAGLIYSYSADMFDYLHPNNTGYEKMAAKWFQTIVNLNARPQVSDISLQTANEGSAFTNLLLDNYVTDNDDSDSEIDWSFKKQNNSHLTVSIDENRILHVSPSNGDWYGSETIRLIASDDGNGAFIRKDSTDVVFMVISQNDPPVIISAAITNATEDVGYTYTVTATDVDNSSNQLVFSAPVKPGWLNFNSVTHILSGTPSNDNVGLNNVKIRVSDGTDYTEQTFQINVENVNDAPVITSTPVLNGYVNNTYMYEVIATDIDVGDELTFTADSIPDWLEFTTGSSNAYLSNTPAPTDTGSFSIILEVSDGKAQTMQKYTLRVFTQSSDHNLNNSVFFKVYPNPVKDKILFEFSEPGDKQVEIFNIQGILLKYVKIDGDNKVEIDLKSFSPGLYLFRVHVNTKMAFGKFTKSM
jgi:hypothetical protein